MNRHRSRFYLSAVTLFALLLTTIPLAVAQPGGSDKIEPALLGRLAVEGRADWIVRFVEQADLSAAYSMDWDARGVFVYATLREVAQRSQVRAQQLLDNQGLDYRTFIAGNELYVWGGDLRAATALAGLPEVAFMRATRTYYIDPIITEDNSIPAVPNALAWGLLDVHADQFWSAFGVQGDGIVVANIDTGVEYTHDALDQSYRCAPDGSDPACWEDPSNICPGGVMCDNNGHGTHTMGTMVADDDPSLTWQAGMAPNAQWIACKGCESGSCSDLALNACADWILAPDSDPANRPHVVNNSWGGDGCDNWYQAKVQAWRAAGIFPAFSSGNSSGCSSMGSPGDYQESFATTGHDSSRGHAYSQGPSCYGHEPYTKPNITAPAVSVCSTIPGNGWTCGYSGTSMASPHSAGAVALLWSCNPAMIGDLPATFEALQNTADAPDPTSPPCGAPPDGEGTYEDGYGYLNIYAAGTAYCAVEMGHLDGYVYEDPSGDPIAGAEVSTAPGGGMATTDATGYYTMTLVPGTYDATASRAGYISQTVTGVVVVADTVTQQDFSLTYAGGWHPGPSDSPFEWNRFDGVFNPVDELLYFPGGRTGEVPAHDRSIWTYDPVNDTWADTGCDLLHNASNVTPLLVEDDGTGRGEAIYVIGGYDADAALNIDAVQRYYPSRPACVVEKDTTDPYPGVSPGSLVVGTMGYAEVDGLLYVFGGWESATPHFSDETWVYDPQGVDGSRWTLLAATLTPARAAINTAVQGDLIYAMGGYVSYTGSDLVPTDVAEVYDPANAGLGWQPIASMPVATAEGRGFGFDVDTLLDQPAGYVYVVGGGDWPAQSAEVLEYDVATDTWDDTFPELLQARRNHAGVYVPVCTADPTDGLPGMWVFGGRITGDSPPFGDPEYFPVACAQGPSAVYLPLVYKSP